MKKGFAALLVVGILASAPMTAALAASKAPASQGPDTKSVIALHNTQKLTKDQISALKSVAMKNNNTMRSIQPNIVQSPDYTFHLEGDVLQDSPSFYHSSGQIIVTLVQWSNAWLSSADCYWSVVSDATGMPVISREVSGDYTSTNYTINFGTLDAGNYRIRVANMNSGDVVDGNYYFYY